MKIWFGTTTLEFAKYKQNHLGIRQYLLDCGHVLTDDWIADHLGWLENNPHSSRDIKTVYNEVINAINKADVSIIEFTIPNFSTSHQITYTLQLKKPVLVLRLKREGTFPDSYIEAIDSPFLTVKQYNLENYKEIISEFLNYSSLEEGDGRYNIVLGKREKYYLDWASNRYKQSRSQIIRNLIDSKMNEDQKFNTHLRTPS